MRDGRGNPRALTTGRIVRVGAFCSHTPEIDTKVGDAVHSSDTTSPAAPPSSHDRPGELKTALPASERTREKLKAQMEVLIPEQGAHRIRNDVAQPFRSIAAQDSEMMSPTVAG